LSDLEVKKDRLELQLTKKDNEMEKIKRKLEDKDIDIKNLKDKNEEFKNKIKEGEQKVLNLEIEMKKFRERIEGYEQDNSSLRKEITTLTTSFGRAKDENSELSDMITKLRTQLENRRSSLKDSSQLDEDEFEEYKNATETLISNYKSQIEELERKNTDLAAKYEQIHSDFKDNKEQEYLAKIKDLTHKIDLIESLDSSQKATIKELESRIETLMEEKLGREREHQDSKGELHGKHRALETQFKQVNDKLKDREEYVKTLESKITRIEEEKIYFISNEEQKREEIMYEFKSELKELKEKCHELENKNDELLIEKDTLQQKLKREQNSNLDSDDILEGNQRMLSQIKLLQNQLLDKDKKIIDLQEGLESSPKKGGTRQSKRDNNKDKLVAELGVENEFLTKQVKELQSRLNLMDQINRSSESSVDNDGYYGNLAKGHGSPQDLIVHLKKENTELSQELIKIKTLYAEADQERETKLRERTDRLKKFSTEITKYELDMVKAKQSLGEALNMNIELELYNAELIQEIDRLKLLQTDSQNQGKGKKKKK
jgi:chromosome segregation ATPase